MLHDDDGTGKSSGRLVITVCSAWGPPVEEPITTIRMRACGSPRPPIAMVFFLLSVIFYALHLTALYLEEVADDLIPQAA